MFVVCDFTPSQINRSMRPASSSEPNKRMKEVQEEIIVLKEKNSKINKLMEEIALLNQRTMLNANAKCQWTREAEEDSWRNVWNMCNSLKILSMIALLPNPPQMPLKRNGRILENEITKISEESSAGRKLWVDVLSDNRNPTKLDGDLVRCTNLSKRGN